MQVILAYALFILLMAAPFIVAAVLVSGLLAGFILALRGLASGQSATVVRCRPRGCQHRRDRRGRQLEHAG